MLRMVRNAMAEYIEREAAIESLPVAWDSAINALRNAPAADVAPVVHGRWEAKGYVCGESEFECSVCHKTEWRTSISRFRWCPFCGAMMDGDDDG